MATGAPFQHWPLPAQLLQRLPQAPVEQPSDPNGAEVPFRGSGSALEWLDYAVRVHEQDKLAEARKKRLLTWGVTCLVVGFIGLFAFFIGVIPMAIGIYLLVRRGKVDKLDVEDRRLEVFTGTLRTLAPELKPKKPIEVDLDFSAYTQHATMDVRNSKEYQQRWLSLKLPFRDGSCMAVSVTLQVKEKSKPKRKYTKLKRRQTEQVVVRVIPPRGRSFKPNSLPGRVSGRAVNGLRLQKAIIEPRHATFVWSSWVSTNVRGRGGWSSRAVALESKHLVTTLLASYRLSAQGERSAT